MVYGWKDFALAGQHWVPWSKPDADQIWLLVSDLQKSIRFGQSNAAAGIASKIYALDPVRLQRRLSVIAFEDVGLANPQVALGVALLPWKWPEVTTGDRHAVLVGATIRLAEGCKSRLCCDSLVAGKYLPTGVKQEAYDMGFDAATENFKTQRNYRNLARLGVLLHEKDMPLPDWANWDGNLLNSFKIIGAMARSYVFFAHLIGKEYQAAPAVEMPAYLEGGHPYYYASLDKHTRPGLRAMLRFVKENKHFNYICNYAQIKPYKRREVLAVLAFRCEGALLTPMKDIDIEHELVFEIARHRLRSVGVPKGEEHLFIHSFNSVWRADLNAYRIEEINKPT